jgi:predicted nucleic acid-binding Zn ribbon protein
LGEKLVQHKHCQSCGKAMAYKKGEDFCSDECKAQFDSVVKKRRNLLYFWVASIIIMLCVLAFVQRAGM